MASTTAKSGYHHGDLRATLVLTAMTMLEAGEVFSLRALAREAGVSTAAPYRHFADRDQLESALAVQGLHDLMRDLAVGRSTPRSAADVGDLAVAYVHFALQRPALFRLMFGRECDDQDDERVRAAAALHDHLIDAMTALYPRSDARQLATAGWSLAHGLAFLHLDGKFDASDSRVVDERVRSTFTALFPTPETETSAP